MKATKIISACAVLVALASCSNDHVISQPGAEDTPIHIQANVGAVTTKAASNIQDQYFDANEKIGIFLREHLETGETSIISYTQPLDGNVDASTANATISIPTQYYPSNGHGVDCLAIYPKQNGDPATDIKNGTNTFSVKDDQSDKNNYKASDLMFAYKPNTKNSDKKPIELTFSHLLSKIIVEVCVEDGGSVDKKVLKDVYVDLKTVNKTIGITVSDMSQTVGSTTPTTTAGSVDLTSTVSNETIIKMGKPGVSSSDDKKTNEVAAIIVPQTIADTKPFIQVRLNDGTSDYATYTYNVSNASGLTFNTKMSYKYTITLKAGGISVQSVQINPWTPASDGSGDANLD